MGLQLIFNSIIACSSTTLKVQTYIFFQILTFVQIQITEPYGFQNFEVSSVDATIKLTRHRHPDNLFTSWSCLLF